MSDNQDNKPGNKPVTMGDLSPMASVEDIAEVLKDGGDLTKISPYLQKKQDSPIDPALGGVYPEEVGREIKEVVMKIIMPALADTITQVALHDRIPENHNLEVSAGYSIKTLACEIASLSNMMGITSDDLVKHEEMLQAKLAEEHNGDAGDADGDGEQGDW